MVSTTYGRAFGTTSSFQSNRSNRTARRKPSPPIALSFILSSLALLALSLYLLRYTFSLASAATELAIRAPPPRCDVFDGRWLPHAAYPLYNSSDCPFAERGFNCLANGRNDTDYLRWRWRPHGCEVPRFDARRVLERLRGKRVVFIGDSMSRTQWESLICMLMTGVGDRGSVYEVNGSNITKTIRFLGVRFRTFDLSVDFYRSVFLIQQGGPPRHGPKRVRSTLRLDRLDEFSRRWVDADVLVFNSGHWWNPVKLFDAGCYFQVGGSLKLGMPISLAFRTAMETWASWVQKSVNTSRTHVFFRTFEPSHWSGTSQKVCKVSEEPMVDSNGNDPSVFSDIIADVIFKMSVPVTVLNVTSMGAVRSDAHIGMWGDLPSLLDCSHWCLPGVPDMWNELIFSYLLTYDKLHWTDTQ